MQKEIQLTDKTLLVVGLPEDASNLELSYFNYQKQEYTDDLTLIYKSLKEHNLKRGDRPHSLLPKGNWQLLGIYPELTEEQAKQVVTQSIHTGLFMHHNGIDNIYCYKTALESFQSLMEREKCYTVNPYGNEPKKGEYDASDIQYFQSDLSEWQEAQQTTFEKYAILIKSK